MSQVILIIGAHDETATWLTGAIGHQAVALPVETVTGESAMPLRGIAPEELPEAIVFTAQVPVERALAIAADVHGIRPDVDMALIAATEKQIMLEAMRAGIRDVSPSIEDPAFLSALRDRMNARGSAAPPVSPAEPRPRVEYASRTVTVLSPKGGVGKTSIAANLAVALAQRSPMEVVLVDLDLQFGDLSTVLDLTPSHTLEDAFGAGGRDSLLLKTYLTVHPAGFHVMCGADSPAANDQVTDRQVAALIGQLQTQFRYVIIDTAAGLGDVTLAALERSDDAVFVSTMDVACLRSVRKELDLLSELKVLPSSRYVLLNFADRQSGLRVKDVEAVLGVPVDVALPRAKEVTAASNRGVPVLLDAKNSGFSKAIRSFAKRIDDRASEAEEKQGHRRLEVA